MLISYRYNIVKIVCPTIRKGLATPLLVVEGKKHPNPEKNGRELNLVSIDAEFPIGRHIQNPLKSSIGKKIITFFN